ncbi:MAG: DMT family transporter [Anaerolineae bacterium]|nr:DMT family transporter [Anaerolineae bacterium]MDK1081933.1 DMT family transporter [Anaerolineae bacterium]MDK1118326.1 DMT family transporter [Anaerolineae bacterium]
MNDSRLRFALPIAIIIGILAVSTASIFIRFAQREAHSLVIAALRLAFATLALAPVALTRYRNELINFTRKEVLLGFISGIFLAVHFATWISSLEFTSVANSVVLVSTGPLWVALLAPIFLKEPLTKPLMFGLPIAFLGGALIGLSDSCTLDQSLVCKPFSDILEGEAYHGNFLALAGAWALAGYIIIGRVLRGKLSLIPYIFMVYGFAAIVLFGFMVLAGENPFGLSPIIYLWIILLALLPQLVGHTSYNWALRYLPAALVSTITLGEPIGSGILAYYILKEIPTILTITGGVLILLGILISTRPK